MLQTFLQYPNRYDRIFVKKYFIVICLRVGLDLDKIPDNLIEGEFHPERISGHSLMVGFNPVARTAWRPPLQFMNALRRVHTININLSTFFLFLSKIGIQIIHQNL